MNMISVDDFSCEKECLYHGEKYSVRDNGAVKRHAQLGRKTRKLDNVWTFGKASDKTGYMEIAGERVHRIVAFAFLGEPPEEDYVVDHIDTNRRNNRPENLRWVTKLENVLNNPITRARIENICGSIEAFLENPSLLNGHENTDPNFNWMRTVSREEARASLERLTLWSKGEHKPQGGTIGEWIFENKNTSLLYSDLNENAFDELDEIEEEYPSLTENAIQLNWKTPTLFPRCPSGNADRPLEKYYSNLNNNEVFCLNEYNKSIIHNYALSKTSDKLLVVCKFSDFSVKQWSLIEVSYKNGLFYHKSLGTFFDEEGAQKYFTLGLGKEWTGEEVFDDFC